MTTFNWKKLLTQWSRDVLDSAYAETLPGGVGASAWLGYPEATAAQIDRAEARLKQQLPPSYRAFLRVSNGFRLTGSLLSRLLPVKEIDWFGILNPSAATKWTRWTASSAPGPHAGGNRHRHSPGQEQGELPPEQLTRSLQISGREMLGMAVLLLNPHVLTGDGEWEAWYFTPLLPGAFRYRSFWELMQAEYQSFLTLREQMQQGSLSQPAQELLLRKLPELVEALQDKAQKWNSASSELGTCCRPGISRGLNLAARHVGQIQDQIWHPQLAYRELYALADALEYRWRQGVATGESASHIINPLLTHSDHDLQSEQSAAVCEGYRQAVSVIRDFFQMLESYNINGRTIEGP